MCTLFLLVLLLGVWPDVAAAQHPSRPGTVGVTLQGEPGAVLVDRVLDDSPAGRAGIRPLDRVLAVDGAPIGALGPAEVAARLRGAIGEPVEVVIGSGSGERTVSLERADLFAPGPGYAEAIETRHFRVHFQPDRESRIFARELATELEQRATETLGGTSVPRKVHLFIVRGRYEWERKQLLPWGMAWQPISHRDPDRFDAELAYLRYGEPGSAGRRLLGREGWPVAGNGSAHRSAVETLLQHGTRLDASSVEQALLGGSGSVTASLREYIRERWGEERFVRLWRAEGEPTDAVQRVLDVDAEQLVAGWREAIYSLPPDPEAGPGAAELLLAGGWIAVFAVAAVWVARRRQVG